MMKWQSKYVVRKECNKSKKTALVIMNLFPTIEGANTNSSAVENLKQLQEELTKVDDVMIAVGTCIETNKEAVSRLKMMVAILLDKK